MNWKQFREGVLRPTLEKLQPTIQSTEAAVRLVGETIWHESDRLQALGQYPRDPNDIFGPGLGPCSMERPTWEWLVEAHFPTPIQAAFHRATGLMISPMFNHYDHFAWNLALNVAGCRLRYFAVKEALPIAEGDEGIIRRAAYWFKYYNASGVEARRIKYIDDANALPWV